MISGSFAPMSTVWQQVEVRGIVEIPGLPGVRVEALPVFKDARGSLHELFRVDEVPAGFKPLMACSSWSHPGVARGPHQHVGQDDYFTSPAHRISGFISGTTAPAPPAPPKAGSSTPAPKPRRASTSRAAWFMPTRMWVTLSASSSLSPASCSKAKAAAIPWTKSGTS